MRLRFGLRLQCDRVAGVRFVPEGGNFLSGLADVLAVPDVAGEGAGGIQRRKDALVHPHADAELAFQVDAGAEDRFGWCMVFATLLFGKGLCASTP